MKIQSNTISTGLAMFSMFFGAGNVVFPLALGQFSESQNFFSLMGLMISAVGVPFLGLISMTLFNGDYKAFFERIGKIPGGLMLLFIMLLIGPFGAMPRLIALSFSTAKMYLPEITQLTFSIISCAIIYVLTYKRSRLLDILGYVLTPILLGSLVILVLKGLLAAPEMPISELNTSYVFFEGLWEGYNTMDLMGAFLFSSIVITCLKSEQISNDSNDSDKSIESINLKRLVSMTFKAGCIGMSLLGLVYAGLSYVAAYNSQLLEFVPADEMLGHLAIQVLGPHAGIVAVIAVALACLTTAIALAAVFAEFLHEDVSMKKIDFKFSLLITLLITLIMSTLNFSGIMTILTPILIVCYPTLILLAIINIAYKLYGFQPVKLPVFVLFAISLAIYLYVG